MSKNQMALEVEIIRGMHDADLSSLSAAIRARRDALKQEKKLSFKVYCGIFASLFSLGNFLL